MPARGSVSGKARVEEGRSVSIFSGRTQNSFPVWDDNQIQQENWGAPLAATQMPLDASATAAAAAKPSRPTRQARESNAGALGSGFEDKAGRQAVEEFIHQYSLYRFPSTDKAAEVTSQEEATAEAPTIPFEWRRPVDVVTPFRPVVHRNTTPFVNPYASNPEELLPFDSKAEVTRYTTQSQGGSPTGKRSISGGGSGSAAHRHSDITPTGPFHLLYPEAISAIDDMVGQSATMWRDCTPLDAVRNYRAMASLKQPYDPTLMAGCVETPAEACESRYSTALRHKLKQADELAALERVPPFLMSAMNSALLAVEQAQRFIPSGFYLWELIYPHAPGTCHPVYNPHGKYAVKLFLDGAYRKIIVDDVLPVDALGQSYTSYTSRRELWPTLLTKAIIKGLGPVLGTHAFIDAPELIVGTLMGKWIPQYLEPKTAVVESTAMLLTYQRQLDAAAAAELQPSTVLCREDGGGGIVFHQSGPRGGGRSAPSSATSENVSRKASRNSSAQGKRGVGGGGGGSAKKGNATPSVEEFPILVAHEVCLPTPVDDEPIDDRPFYLCGLRDTAPAAGVQLNGYGTGTQLYVIRRAAPFRNTVAFLIQTTPRVAEVDGVFEREREASDVQQVQSLSSSTPKRTADNHRNTPGFSCWLTLEEVVRTMDRLIIWRPMDGRYSNTLSIGGDALASGVTSGGAASGGTGATKGTRSLAATTKEPSPQEEMKKSVTLWWKLYSPVSIEAMMIVSSPPLQSLTEKRDEPVTPTASESTTVVPPLPKLDRMSVDIDTYAWDRAEPVNRGLVFSYEQGKLGSVLLRLAGGTHLLRLTMPSLHRLTKLSFLSNAEIDVKKDRTELSPPLFVQLTDAGVYPDVLQYGAETVWLKRVFTVSKPTIVTLVLSTLPSSADLADHRQIITASSRPAVAAKGHGKGGGGGRAGNSAATSPAKNSKKENVEKIVPVQPSLSVADDADDTRILRHTKLCLVNLDKQEESCIGEAGRLVELDVEPNEKGYLIIAYTSSAAIVAQTDSQVGAPDRDTQATMDSTILFPAGKWKLVVRSNLELTSFDTIPHTAGALNLQHTLSRGGAPLLFRKMCSITEATHMSILAVLAAPIPMTFALRVSQVEPQQPTSASGARGVRGMNTTPATPPVAMTTAAASATVIFESGPQSHHLFVPDLFFPFPVDKNVRSVAFMMEATVAPNDAVAWDDFCRIRHASKFLEVRQLVEKMANMVQERELADYEANPAAFLSRKREELESQRAMSQDTVEKSSKTSVTSSGKKLPSAVEGKKKKSVTTRPTTRQVLTDATLRGDSVTRRTSSLLQQNSEYLLQNLDAEDPKEQVHIDISLSFSNTRVDVRDAAAETDPVLELRLQMKETVDWLQSRAGKAPLPSATATHTTPGRAAPPTSSSGKQQRPARDAAMTMEDIMHSDVARQCRLEFLENPKNLYMPNLDIVEGSGAGGTASFFSTTSSRKDGPPHTSASTSDGLAALLAPDGDASSYRYAPLLEPEEFSVELLPLRAREECLPALSDEAATAAGLGNSTIKRPKPSLVSKQQTHGSSSAAMSSFAAADGLPTGAGSSWPLSQEECEEVLGDLRGPMRVFAAVLDSGRSAIRSEQLRCRHQFKKMYTDFFEEAVAKDPAAMAVAPAAADPAESAKGGDVVVKPATPLVSYISLLGTREEEVATQAKQKRSLVAPGSS